MKRSVLSHYIGGALAAYGALAAMPAANAQNGGGPGFLSTYTGPQGADLEVTSATVVYTGTSFIFSSTFAAPVGTTVGAYYVWGINTGTGTAGFAGLGATQNESGVLFNDVIIAHPTVDAITTSPSLKMGGTTLPTSDMSFSVDTLTLILPASILPSTGFAPTSYTANLWPRFEGTFDSVNVTGNASIAQFAPNNSDLAVTNASAPEPVSLALIASQFSICGVVLAVRRRRTASSSL